VTSTDHPNPQLTQLLDIYLEEILSGTATLAEVLAQYPEASALKRELQTALLTARLTSDVPVLSDASMAKLEARLHAVTPAQRRPASRIIQFPVWQLANKWVAALILIILFALSAGGGTVAVAANSQPGDTLYGVKRAWEQVIVFVANIVGRADDVYLHLAKVRFEEIYTLARQDKLSPAELDDFAVTLRATIRLADDDSTPAIVVFMMTAQSNLQLMPPKPDTEISYKRVETLLQPRFDANGHLLLVDGLPAPASTPQPVALSATPTNEPALTNTPVPTEIVRATFTATSTATDAPPTATSTPSRTPTATNTLPPTPTLTNTPTLTLTPLTLPGQIVTATRVLSQTTNVPIIPTQPATGGGGPPAFPVRETEAAVYATQTAIANGQIQPTPTE
jgi:hypothetical protein